MKKLFVLVLMLFSSMLYANSMELVTYSDLRLRATKENRPTIIATWVWNEGNNAIVTFTDSTLSGNDGCNNFRGSLSINGDSLEVGPLMATRKYCGELNNSDTQFSNAIQNSKYYEIKDDTLTLFDKDKEVLIVLEKKK